MINETVRKLRALTISDGADVIYKTMVDAADEIEGLMIESRCWELVARELEKKIGKGNYADFEYARIKELVFTEQNGYVGPNENNG